MSDMSTTDNNLKENINVDNLIVLLKDYKTNMIVTTKSKIDSIFKNEVQIITQHCEDENVSLENLYEFFKNFHAMDDIEGSYDYVENIMSSYRNRFFASPKSTSAEIIKEIEEIDKNISNQRKELDDEHKSKTINFEKYELEISKLPEKRKAQIESYKSQIKFRYSLWNKAYSMKKAHEKCFKKNKDIIALSHRNSGWSNPAYKLTENFSLEIKTNFGYGNASYFYIMITYKGIPIVPFTDWIHYGFVNAFEMINFTKSFPLNDIYWIDAMEYARNACNLSLIDEVKFVKIYLVDECENLISGLKEILISESITVKRFRRNHIVNEYIRNHAALMIFRSEKISGTLDFITKLKEYSNIITVNHYIKEIEEINQNFRPTLEKLIKEYSIKISKEENELKEIEKALKKMDNTNDAYLSEREKLKNELTATEIKSMEPGDIKKVLKKALEQKYPDHENFIYEYNNLKNQKNILFRSIIGLNNYLRQLTMHMEKMQKYFNPK